MTRHSLFTAFACLAAIAASFSSCGGDGGSGSPGTQPTSSPSPGPTVTVTPSPTPLTVSGTWTGSSQCLATLTGPGLTGATMNLDERDDFTVTGTIFYQASGVTESITGFVDPTDGKFHATFRDPRRECTNIDIVFTVDESSMTGSGNRSCGSNNAVCTYSLNR